MNQPQLPAHLQNRQSRHLAEVAAQGLGGALPPHISIRGNAFALVDATGASQPVVFVNPADNRQYNQPYLDLCIVDISDVICKQYYGGKDWTPDSNDPPVCWSANGIAPSREAATPQCRTCAECPHNVRGSAVSRISGASIKACRDEKWLCVTPPGFGKDMLFQLKLTPGSFQNWKGYVEKFKGQQVDISDVVTRIEFEQGVNGVLLFNVSPAGYIDLATADLRERVLLAKSTDIFVGRNDVPIQQMLSAPTAAGSPAAPVERAVGFSPLLAAPYGNTAGVVVAPLASAATASFQPSPGPALPPSAAPAVPPVSFQTPLSPTGFVPAGGVTPAPAEQPGRRRRRTAAQIAADNAAAQQSGQAQPQPNPSVAPFRPAPVPAAAPPIAPAGAGPYSHAAGPTDRAGNPAPFGMAQGQAPDAGLADMLNRTFGPAPGAPR